jgi:hypothetical protein
MPLSLSNLDPVGNGEGGAAAGEWVSIRHAAAFANVSVDTIRRRIKMEQIPWRRDPRGRYMVTIPSGWSPAAERAPGQEAAASLLLRLRNCAALLNEIRTQRDLLLRHVEVQQHLLEAHAQSEADLRRLLLVGERASP